MIRMIKKIVYSFIVIIIILMSGCNESNIDSFSSDDQYCFVRVPICSITESDKGFYYRGGPHDQFLYFIDKKTMKSTVLCNKPDCLHFDEPDSSKIANCNAFIFNTSVEMIYYDSSIYMRNMFQLPTTPGFDFSKISKDGTQRKIILTFKELLGGLVMHRGHIYYLTSDNGTTEGKEDTTETKMRLYRLPVNDIGKAPELLYEYSGVYANVGQLLGYGDNILIGYRKFTDASMQKENACIMSYNIKDGSIKQISGDTCFFSVCGGKIVYPKNRETFQCNIDGTGSRLLDGVVGLPYNDDTYIITDTEYYEESIGNTARRQMMIYDMDGNVVQSFDIAQLKQPILLGSNSDYIFIRDIEAGVNEFGNITTLWAINKAKLKDGASKMEKIYEFVPKVKNNGVVTVIG